jgi:hypothetical protein
MWAPVWCRQEASIYAKTAHNVNINRRNCVALVSSDNRIENDAEHKPIMVEVDGRVPDFIAF